MEYRTQFNYCDTGLAQIRFEIHKRIDFFAWGGCYICPLSGMKHDFKDT